VLEIRLDANLHLATVEGLGMQNNTAFLRRSHRCLYGERNGCFGMSIGEEVVEHAFAGGVALKKASAAADMDTRDVALNSHLAAIREKGDRQRSTIEIDEIREDVTD
jgi:hypothetical protein